MSEQPQEQTNMLAVIERASRSPEVDVEKMRALLEMHEHVLEREAAHAFNAAMAQAHTEMPPVACDKENPHTHSRYPSMEAVQKSIKAVYLKHGFTCTFAEDGAPADGMIHVIGTVRHVAGHTEIFHRYAPADTAGPGGKANKTEVQGSQSTVTFLSRRLLCSIWGVTIVGDDKDGNAVVDLVSKEQQADLKAMLDELETADNPGHAEKVFLQYFKVEKLADLPASEYQRGVKAIQKKRAAA